MGRQILSAARVTERVRTIDIDGQHLSLTVRCSARRRSLALTIDHRGVRLAVPHGTPETMIMRFIHDHRIWLRERLAQWCQPVPLVLTDGATFPLLGAPARLRLDRDARRAAWRHVDGTEELCMPASAAVGATIVRALKLRALAWFGDRVEEYCQHLAIAAPTVRLTSARSRWGSCSRISGIRLHWRLIHLPAPLIDYVVAHEVAHLVEMNHSPRFWKIVGQLYPDWQSARRRLREMAATLPAIDDQDIPLHFSDNQED
ncbi:MAG: M48 family metallopeptidase [Azoarcus sp.]|jgi:predicted metal-dependent hydrolase|nr:M48 family metallopeptidase [Azoarcus sp.]